MARYVDVITAHEVHNSLKEWLRGNLDVGQREYVGRGFMALKKRIVDDGDMTNTKVMIYDESYDLEYTIQTHRFSGRTRKIYKVSNNQMERCDTGYNVLEKIKFSVPILVQMLREIMVQIIGNIGTDVAYAAIGWK